jgi:multidrug efflux pump
MFTVPLAMAGALFVVPVAYDLLARHTGSPGDVKRQLEAEAAEDSEKGGRT